MDEAHLKTYTQLAEAIYKHAYKMAKNEDNGIRKDPRYKDIPAPIYDNNAMSTFEEVTEALTKLNIMTPHDPAASICSFNCALEDISDVVRKNWKKGQSFDELLATFVGLFGEFGTTYWGFETARDRPFKPGEHLRTVLSGLASLGYASVEGESYRWTEKMHPIMSSPKLDFWPNENIG